MIAPAIRRISLQCCRQVGGVDFDELPTHRRGADRRERDRGGHTSEGDEGQAVDCQFDSLYLVDARWLCSNNVPKREWMPESHQIVGCSFGHTVLLALNLHRQYDAVGVRGR